MIKTWISSEKGDDKIIALANNKILKANPREAKTQEVVTNIENDTLSADILSIPFSYIRSVQLPKGKKYIQVNFGEESEEHLRICNEFKRVEIFKYFRENIPQMTYRFEKYSKIKAMQKPLIAVAVVAVLFLWTMFYAVPLSMGAEYELTGNGGSLTGIVFSLAMLGIPKICLIFGTLLLLGTYSAIVKGKNPPEIHELHRG